MTHSLNGYRRAFATVLALLILSVPLASSAEQTSPAFDKALEKGEALMEKGKYEKAVRELKKAEELSTESSVRVLLDLAICFNRIGKSEDAESYAQAALEVAEEPFDQAGAYNQLGLSLLSGALRDSEKLSEAEVAFRKVLEITGGQVNVARYNLGEVLQRQARYQEAHTAFAEYLERQPDGERSAQARLAMEWIPCVQTVGPIRVEGDVKGPVKIFSPPPQFTGEARKKRVQGVMIIEAIIDKNGSVRCLNILKGLPSGLSQAAAEAVRKWKFKPATLHGKPVAVIYNLTINMRLQ